VPLRVQILSLCKAIARVRKTIMPQGVNMPHTNDEDRARLQVAITVLEEDMLQASPPFRVLYSQRIESKLAKIGPNKEFAHLVAKIHVVENFSEGGAIGCRRKPSTEEDVAAPVSTEDTSFTGTTETITESNSKSKSKKMFKRGASMYDVSKPVARTGPSPLVRAKSASYALKSPATEKANELGRLADELERSIPAMDLAH